MSRLYAFAACAPYSAHERRGVGRRGLHQLVTEAEGFAALALECHGRFVEAARERGVALAPAFHLPWGREMAFVPVDGHEGQYTDMRADAKNIADADSRWQWLSPALAAALVPALGDPAPAVYFGGNPSTMTLGSAGLLPLHHFGVTLVGDATAIQTGTPMLESLIRAHAGHTAGRGGVVMVEANWVTEHRLPCVATWHLWGKDGRYAWGDAPEGSGVLFRQGIGDPDEWAAAEAAAGAGLTLWVNLTRVIDTERLFSLVRETAP